jgi:hypothetical protein
VLIVSTVADVFEIFAPGVQSAILGESLGAQDGAISAPFTGGQCQIAYIVRFNLMGPDFEGPQNLQTVLPGPINGIELNHGKGISNVIVTFAGGQTQPLGFSNDPMMEASLSGIQVFPAFNVPDNCGNPPGVIETPETVRRPGSSPQMPGAPASPIGTTAAPPSAPQTSPPRSPGIGGIIGGVGVAGLPFVPAIGRAPDSTPQTGSMPGFTPMPGNAGCSGGSCGGTLRDGQEAISANQMAQMDALAQILQGLDLLQGANITGRLDTINTKLGPQIANSVGQNIGISGFLGNFQQRVESLFRSLGGDRILAVASFAATVHNGVMLSQNLGFTLVSVIEQALSVVGINDPDGNPLDIRSAIGRTVTDLITSIIGEETFQNTSEALARANRIYQATANIAQTIQSTRAAAIQAAEDIGSMNARIGNALKRSGVVADSSYPFFNPTPNYDNAFTNAIENLDNRLNLIQGVTSNVLDIQQNAAQLQQQRDEFQQLVSEGTESDRPENQEQLNSFNQSVEASASPPINDDDFIAPSPEG